MKHLQRLLTLLGLSLLVPAIASAHSSIYTYKYIDGNTFVMVTHNVTEPQANEPIEYNIRLYDLDGRLIPFQTVQAAITEGDNTAYQTTATMSANNDATITYSYPHKSTYQLALTFLDHDKQIAAAKFPVTIAHTTAQSLLTLAIPTVAAFLLGALLATAVFKRQILKHVPAKIKHLRKPGRAKHAK
jgi:hypothetical protein